MANEVVRGLFGFSPSELSMQRQAEDDARAFQMAQLSPLQQTAALGFQSGNRVARAAGDIGRSLFNVQDPEVAEQAMLSGMAKELYGQGVDPMSTRGLSTMIQRLNASGARPQTLEKLSGALQAAQMREAKLQSEQALAASRGREQDPVMKLVESGKYTPESIRAFAETRDISVLKFKDVEKEAKRSSFAQQLIDEGLEPGSPAFQARMREYNLADIQGTSKKGQTTVTVNQPVPPSAKKLGEAAGTEIGKKAADVENQQQIINASKQALRLLDKGIYSGPYAQAQQITAKLTRGAVGDLNKVVNTESFLNTVRSNVIPMLAAFGGNDSNEEKQFLERLVGGDITAEPDAIRSAVVNGMRKAEANITRLRKQLKAAEKGETIPIEAEADTDPLGIR